MNANAARCRGFTLFELMVTLTVVAVLAVIGVPSFRDLLRKNQVSSANNALLADLSYARSEAITRGSIVSICPSSTGTSCATSKQLYEAGWIIYTFTPGNAVAATDYDSTKSTNILLRYRQALAGVSLRSTATQDLSFGPQGQTLPASSTYTFQTCFQPKGQSGAGSSSDRVPGASLTITGSGSVISQKIGVDADCTP